MRPTYESLSAGFEPALVTGTDRAMRFVMRAYGRRAPMASKRDVTEIRLRAHAPQSALDEARGRWEQHAKARRWRGYSVFDTRGALLDYVPAETCD